MWGPALMGGSAYPVDPRGEPVGVDFANFYLASRLALSGEPAAVYDRARFDSYRTSFFPLQDREVFPWVYPPLFLLLMLPLALLPYLAALGVWQAVSLGLFLGTLRRLAPHPFTLLLALGFPATFINFFTAQNGFITVFLMGGGLLLLGSRPFLGGLLLGMLVYKPHLGVLVPVALLAGRGWRALLGAGASAAALALASLVVLGAETWQAYLSSIPSSVNLLDSSSLPWKLMPSVFAAARVAGADPALARLLHGAVMAGVAAAVVWTWSRRSSPYLRHSAFVLASLLFTPYLFFYDYVCLALPLAWLGWEGCQRGFGRGEKALLAIAWLSPLSMMPFQGVKLPGLICPLVLSALLVLTLLKSRREAPDPG